MPIEPATERSFAVVEDAPSSEDPALITRLREALTAARFTAAGVIEHLGEAAVAGLDRDQAVPALRALAEHRRAGTDSPLSTLVELFVLARPVPEPVLAAGLNGVCVDDLVALRLVERCGPDEVRSLVDLDLHSSDDGLELWVAADLTAFQRPGVLRRDHVLGIGGASLTLAQLTERRPVERALDIGTGCGVQTFHLLAHARHVVATDLSARALAFTRFNLLLNAPALGVDVHDVEQRVELRQGSLLEPVAGEQFDTVVTNPPFVITPRKPGEGDADRYVYRDGGRAGDALVAELIGALDTVMARGATAHLLANWEITRHPTERHWAERVRSWIPRELDAWVIQRETQTPEQYAQTWLHDASEHLDRAGYEASYTAYLEDFASREVAAIGFGYVRLERPGSTSPHPGGVPVTSEGEVGRRRFESVTHPVQQPIAAVLREAVERENLLEAMGEDWPRIHLVVPEHVTEERHLRPGAEDPSVILLRQGAGLQRTVVLTSATAGLVGACDGDLSVAQILTALGALLGWQAPASDSPEGVAVLAEVRHLVIDGFLVPEV